MVRSVQMGDLWLDQPEVVARGYMGNDRGPREAYPGQRVVREHYL